MKLGGVPRCQLERTEANVSFSNLFPPSPQYLAWKVATVTRGESVVNEGLQAGSHRRWPTLRTGDLGLPGREEV